MIDVRTLGLLGLCSSVNCDAICNEVLVIDESSAIDLFLIFSFPVFQLVVCCAIDPVNFKTGEFNFNAI